MSFAVLYSLVRFLLDALLTRRHSELRLQAEVLALRHQIRLLERQVRRPRWQPADRLLLTALSRLPPRPAWSALLVSPETLMRWHRGAAQEVAVPAGGSPAGVIPSAAP